MTRLRELVKDYDENRQREHPTDAVKHKLIRPRSSAHATENLSRARDRVVGAEVVEANGGRVEIIPLVEGLSTTATIERMKSR